MQELRRIKGLCCIMLATYPLLAGIQNITDYESNYLFVKHVMEMDTIFEDSTLKIRAVTNPLIWKTFYGLIIFCEILTGILLLIGGTKLVLNIRNPVKFRQAKVLIYYGLFLGLAIWFFGFIVVAGEWFASWQSVKWNGKNSAFQICTIIFMTLIFVTQSEKD